MSSSPALRHALGLPAGSVRATHLLVMVAIFCLILLIPAQTALPIPPFLIYLILIMVGHYYGSRSSAASGEAPPLYLPRGSIRLLVILAMGGTIGWLIYNDPDGLQAQFEKTVDGLKTQPYLPIVILASFFVGVIFRALLGRGYRALFIQDMEAWLSLVALTGLGIEAVIHCVINPSLSVPIEPATLGMMEAILAGIIAFYFGERS